MDIVLVIIAVVVFVLNHNAKKKREEEARRRKAAMAGQPIPQRIDPRYADAQRRVMPDDPRFPSYAPPATQTRSPNVPVYWPETHDPRFPDLGEGPAMAKARVEEQTRLQEEYAQQRRKQAQPTYTVPVAGSTTLTNIVSNSAAQTKGRRHELESSHITGHAHMETGMGGIREEPCPPARQRPAARHEVAAPTASSRVSFTGLSRDRGTLVQGLIYAEILGKPKALRNAR